MKLALIVVIIVVALLIIHYLFPLIQVCGDSMFPTYRDSEVIIGTRLYKKSNLKIGDVIIYTCPTDDRTVIKRIADIREENSTILFFMLGDNADNSYDSRSYGYISSDRLQCKVLNQRRKM